VAVYVLLAIVRKRLGLQVNLYTFLQVLSLSLFEKTPILQAFHDPLSAPTPLPNSNQLTLLDF
jgi:hypothetical protein